MNHPASDFAIEMQAVKKSFRRNHVLDDLNLQVKRGSTFAFLGRNGAGKTTAIRMLLGLLRRDDGVIRVLGLDPAREPLALRARVGYLAEDQTMYGWMRCYGNKCAKRALLSCSASPRLLAAPR